MDSSYDNNNNLSGLANEKQNEVMSVKNWVITLVITMIPVVGLTMIIVWAFGTEGNKNRRNYSMAVLICLAISVAIYLLIITFFDLFFWRPFVDQV